jgi:hypothetical protein|tara:strand:+ start:573 stop:788 length:216 start_codon:yes stop_codon:yes gene_type:complete
MITRPIKGIEVRVKKPSKAKYNYSAGFKSHLRIKYSGRVVNYRPCWDCPSAEKEINCVCYALVDYVKKAVA